MELQFTVPIVAESKLLEDVLESWADDYASLVAYIKDDARYAVDGSSYTRVINLMKQLEGVNRRRILLYDIMQAIEDCGGLKHISTDHAYKFEPLEDEGDADPEAKEWEEQA